MSHAYHEGLEGYDRRNVFHDGCPECERRAEQGLRALNYLDGTLVAKLVMVTVTREAGLLEHTPSRADAQVMDDLLVVRGLLRSLPFKNLLDVLAMDTADLGPGRPV